MTNKDITDKDIREAVDLARRVMHAAPPDGSVTPAYKLAVVVELLAERLERAERINDIVLKNTIVSDKPRLEIKKVLDQVVKMEVGG